MLDGLCEGIAITVAATVATAPLLAHHFGSVPLAGLARQPPGASRGRAGHVAGDGQGRAWRWPARCCRGATGSPSCSVRSRTCRSPTSTDWPSAARRSRAVGSRCRCDSPGATVARIRRDRRGPGLCAAAGPRRTAPRSPRGALELAAAWRRSPRALRAGGRECSSRLCSCLPSAAVLAAPAPPDDLTVRFLDIGQGDATLIQDGAGAAALFDGGPPEARVYRLLRAAGVRRLDLMVATHQSRDHQGGLREVLERIPIGAAARERRRHAGPGLPAPARARRTRAGIRRMPAPRRRASAGRPARDPDALARRRARPGAPRRRTRTRAAVAAIVSSGDFDLCCSARRRERRHPAAAAAAGRGDEGLPPRQRRPRPARGARAPAAPSGRDRGRRRQLVRPPDALDARGPRRTRCPHVYRTDRDGTVTLTVDDGAHARSRPSAELWRRARRGPPARLRRLGRVAALKPAYLVCGDDDAKIDAWRARVRTQRRGRARPGRARGVRRPPERSGRGGRLARDAELRDRHALPAGGRRGRLEGRRSSSPLEEALGRPATRNRAGPHCARQGAEAAREGGRKGRAARSASTPPPSRGSCRSGASATRASSGCSSTRRPRRSSSPGSGRASSGCRGSWRRSRSPCTRPRSHDRGRGAARRERHRPRRLRPRRCPRGRRPARNTRAGRAARRARRAPGQARLADRAPAARGAPGRRAARGGHAGCQVGGGAEGPAVGQQEGDRAGEEGRRGNARAGAVRVRRPRGGAARRRRCSSLDEDTAFSLALARATR